jgi:hypothetical protein
MEKIDSLLLGNPFGKPLLISPRGRFVYDGLLPGTWLAAYTPLDGAMLLTTDPPAGFIGVSPPDMNVSLSGSLCTFTFSNLSGIDLSVELRAERPVSGAVAADNILARIKMVARNHTRNLLPISLAFSWQDLQGKPPLGCKRETQGISFNSGDGSRLSTTCVYPHTHFSICTGWDPSGSGEEIWDDFFAYGELSDQQYSAAASAICAHSLVAPSDEFTLTVTLEMAPAD